MDRSLIAGANALFRAAESHRRGSILKDAWAHILAERDVRVQAVRYGRFALPPLRRAIDELQTAHCVRHRAIDELLLRAVERDGYKQVVLIGAGYDMRASRFVDRLRGVRFIEADHPATQARKSQLLASCEGVNADVEHVALDLMFESLGDVLARTRLDPQLPTCFIAEGLVHYLTLARLDDLLASTACVNGRARFVLSFIRSDMYARATSTFTQLIKLVGEIPRLHFFPSELARVCEKHVER